MKLDQGRCPAGPVHACFYPESKMNYVRALTTAGLALVMSVHAGSALAQKPDVDPRMRGGEPDVSIRKSVGGLVTEGQVASFTLGVLNAATSTAIGTSAGLTVVDTLPPNFGAPITATGPAGSGWNCGVAGQVIVCHYAGATVNPGGGFPPITVTATAMEAGRFENCANITLEKLKDNNPRDNRSCIRGEVRPGGGSGDGSKYDVGVRKSGPRTITSGQTGTWTLSTINTGPSAVNGNSGVTVVDTLPANLTAPITASGAPDWSCTVSGQVVTCTYIGNPVGPGRAMSPITITAVGGRADGGKNCAWIFAKAGADSRPGDNSSCVEVIVTKPEEGGGKYDVSLRKRGPATVVSGQTATFTLSPNNNGPSSVNNTSGVVVTDTLPAASFTAPITALGGVNWSCTVAGQVVTCTYTGTAPVGPGPMPTITITAIAGRAGELRNCAAIALTRAGPDARPEDNRDCVSIVITPGSSDSKIYDLSMRKRGPDSVSIGQTATFVLSPNNNGPTSVNNTTGIVVTDTLPAFFATPITANGGPNWNCSVVGQVVTCTYIGTTLMGPGALSQINVSAVVGQSGAGRNCAAISVTGATEANTGDNRDCVSVVVRRSPTPAPLTIAKTILDDCYTNGSGNDTQCTFHFVIANGGGASWTGPLVMSDLATPAAGLALVGGQPTGWTCTGASPMVCSSNGPVTIPAFGSVSFDLTLTVSSPVIVTQNCATLTSVPAPSPSSCVPLGRTSATGTLKVTKVIVPAADPGKFNLEITPSGGTLLANLLNGGNGAIAGPVTVAAGNYVVSESAGSASPTSLADYTRVITGDCAANGAVTVTPNSTKQCTITNTRRAAAGNATLTIVKIAQPHSTQPFHFVTQGAGLSPFNLDDDGNSSNALSNTKTFTNLATGIPYTVTEDALPGWTTPSIQCIPAIIGASTTFTDQLNRTFTVNLAPGANMTCTVTNVRTGWSKSATVNIYNPMSPFGPQSVDISAGGTVTFNNVNSGANWTITLLSGPMTFLPIPLANNASGVTIPLTIGTYTYEITGTPSFVVHGTIIVH